jgi:hypothetical protein
MTNLTKEITKNKYQTKNKHQTNSKEKFHKTRDFTSLPQNGHKQIKHLNGAGRFNWGAAA